MNRRTFVTRLAALPALLFGHKALAASPPPEAPTSFDALHEGTGPLPPFNKSALVPDEHEKLYTDVEVMFEEIAKHTKATGDIILSADNPHRFPPTMGFWAQPIGDGPGVGWSIPLPLLARSLKTMEERPDPVPPEERMKMWNGSGATVTTSPATAAALLRECFKTSEGRVKLACAFPGQRSDAAHCEAMQRWIKEHGTL